MFIEKIIGDLDDRRRRREYKSRVNALPRRDRRAVRALERYVTYFGVITVGDGPSDVLLSMFEDLLDPIERAAAAGRPVRSVVGDDPVAFAESILRTHVDAPWRDGELDRSVSAIERRVHNDIERGIVSERRRLVAAISRNDAAGRRTLA